MDICYPSDTDWSDVFDEDELREILQDAERAMKLERAAALGWSLLASLTAYQIGTCPIAVRPAAAWVPGGSFLPALSRPGWPTATIGRALYLPAGGIGYNACGCELPTSCGCDYVPSVELPGPVGSIVSVHVDGVELPSTAYRRRGTRLERIDGERWPVCQDLLAEPDEPGSFVVRYYRGAAPNALTKAAAGALAGEFYKDSLGQECRLPGNITSMNRQGESYEFDTDDVAGVGQIPIVAAVVRIYNPFGALAPAVVATPDMYAVGGRMRR